MRIELNPAVILPFIQEQISKIAADAYQEGGQSMYDAIVMHTRDVNELNKMISSTVITLVAAFGELVSIDGNFLDFRLPDWDDTKTNMASTQATRFVTFDVTKKWLVLKFPSRMDEYDKKAQEAFDNLRSMIYTRKTPSR